VSPPKLRVASDCLARILTVASVMSCGLLGCSKSDSWHAYHRECTEGTARSSKFSADGKPVDWKQRPYRVWMYKICYAKANLYVEGLPVSEAEINPDELRLFLAANLGDKSVESLLRRNYRRDSE